MTFVLLALSKDTTHFYTAGCRETTWRTLLCLSTAPTFRPNPRRAYFCTTTPSFKIWTERGSCHKDIQLVVFQKSRTENMITTIFVNLYFSLIPGQDKVEQNNTNKTHVSVIMWRYRGQKNVDHKTVFVCYSLYKNLSANHKLVCYPFYKRYVTFSSWR